ncbi:MAG: ribbon-helix-helix domain-containing protein [Thermodesulfobacteriota bacterium]|nr:ribbon-helix-helix domain-containing protein [Candidatus Dadabacteria bacterium]
MTAGTIKQRANPQKMHRGSLYIPSLLYERLRLYSFVSRKSQSKIIEEAISNYLEENMTGKELDNVLMYKQD